MLTNMFYQVPDISSLSVSKHLVFLVNQIDLIRGIEFIFIEYSLANLRNEKSNLYSVLFDYALHQINEACIAAEVSEYIEDEIKPIANLLILAGAPEALYISVKLGLELCRDVSPDGFRFYLNLFSEIDSGDMHLVKDYGIYSVWIRAVAAA